MLFLERRQENNPGAENMKQLSEECLRHTEGRLFFLDYLPERRHPWRHFHVTRVGQCHFFPSNSATLGKQLSTDDSCLTCIHQDPPPTLHSSLGALLYQACLSFSMADSFPRRPAQTPAHIMSSKQELYRVSLRVEVVSSLITQEN